jgi:hypothetical protein
MSWEKTAELPVLDSAPCDLYDPSMTGKIPEIDAAMAEQDARRLDEFDRTRMVVPWDEVRSWMETWGTDAERPPPVCRKL